MPRDGSGVHSLPAGYLAVAGQVIQPSQHNPPLEDLSDAITDSIARTGVTPITADIPWGGFKITGLGDATADTDALNRQTGDARYLATTTLSNIGLAASVGASALTISLKTSDGADPSAATPVSIPFRSATAGAGTITRRSVTGANSLVISSGSTMGFSNSTAGRLWVVAFDDGGTVRLGSINCRDGVNIFRLGQFGIASSTAEGGAGAADNPHVFYTGTAVASKAYSVLGYLEWSAGLTTVGAWDIVPTHISPFMPGMKLPGDVVQIATASNSTHGSNNANFIPLDDTIPQNTEGSSISVTPSILPSSSANVLRVSTCGSIGSNFAGTSFVTLTICRSDVANAIVAVPATFYAANSLSQVSAFVCQLIGTTSAFTVSNRYGGTVGTYSALINGTTARFYGAAQIFWLSAEEVMA